MKTLSYIVENGVFTVTGDSIKGTLKNDKHFHIEGSEKIDISTKENKQLFLNKFLQANHNYLLENNDLIDDEYLDLSIDGVVYFFKANGFYQIHSKHFFPIPTKGQTNLFNLYKEFYHYHNKEKQLSAIKRSINGILADLGIAKCFDEIDHTDKGFIITVRNISYHSSYILDFQLLVDNDNVLHFQHFFEPEYEHYSSGLCPNTRNMLEQEITKAKANLERHDRYVEYFKDRKIDN